MERFLTLDRNKVVNGVSEKFQNSKFIYQNKSFL